MQALSNVELDDNQIDELLARATARLKKQAFREDAIAKQAKKTYKLPKLDPGEVSKGYATTEGDVTAVNAPSLLDGKYRKQADGVRKIEDPIFSRKAALEKKKATAGKEWYNIPRTDLTPELKRDLQMIKMRNVLDPHRHYRKDNGKMKPPEYSQIGTMIEGPTEFFSGRIENKNRKRTFVEEVLAGEQETKRFKRKYGELQQKKTGGKKAFYQALKAKRKHGVQKRGP